MKYLARIRSRVRRATAREDVVLPSQRVVAVVCVHSEDGGVEAATNGANLEDAGTRGRPLEPKAANNESKPSREISLLASFLVACRLLR